MAELQDPGSFILQVAPTYADAAAPTTAFLWEVPGGYEGRLLSLTYSLHYSAARNLDKQSFVQVVAQNGDLLNEWLAPEQDWSLSMATFDTTIVSLAILEGDHTLANPGVPITGPRVFGGMPETWFPEGTTFTLIFDTDDNADFLSDVMTMVEGRLQSGALEPDVVPPYTAESYLSQAEPVAA